MMKYEFDALLEAESKRFNLPIPEVDFDFYKVVEEVYTFHPIFDHYKEAKKACVDLMLVGEKDIIMALLPKAVEMEILYKKGTPEEIEAARQEVFV